MTTFLQENKKKNAKNFYCKFCDFGTSNKYNYDKHLMTAKHKHTTKYNENTTKLQENAKPCMQFICDCGKQYPYRASLHNHKKKCNYINNKVETKTTNIEELDDNDPSKELVMKLNEEDRILFIFVF